MSTGQPPVTLIRRSEPTAGWRTSTDGAWPIAVEMASASAAPTATKAIPGEWRNERPRFQPQRFSHGATI